MQTEDIEPSLFHTLSIIIPVYKKRQTVMRLLQRVALQPVSLHKELIVVDDFSTDGTREFLQEADLQNVLGKDGANSVKLALHDRNQGKGAGVRTGLAQATGEIVLIQDADLEYDPGDYPHPACADSRGSRRCGLRKPFSRRVAPGSSLLSLFAESLVLHRVQFADGLGDS